MSELLFNTQQLQNLARHLPEKSFVLASNRREKQMATEKEIQEYNDLVIAKARREEAEIL